MYASLDSIFCVVPLLSVLIPGSDRSQAKGGKEMQTRTGCDEVGSITPLIGPRLKSKRFLHSGRGSTGPPWAAARSPTVYLHGLLMEEVGSTKRFLGKQ
jgi:hypothetical protein